MKQIIIILLVIALALLSISYVNCVNEKDDLIDWAIHEGVFKELNQNY